MMRKLILQLLVVIVICFVLIISCGINSSKRTVVNNNPENEFPLPTNNSINQLKPIVNILRDANSVPSGFQLTWTKVQLTTIQGYYVRRSTAPIADDPSLSLDKIVNVSSTLGGQASKLLPQPAGGPGTIVNAFDIFKPNVGDKYYYRISSVDSDGVESRLSLQVEISVGVHTITSISPTKAGYEQEITISGNNFGSQYDVSTDYVYFSGVTANVDNGFINDLIKAEVTSWSPNQIKVKVPYGATLGKIQVKIEEKVASSTEDFEVSDPYITAISNSDGFAKAAMGTEGTVMQLKGKNFGAPSDFCTVKLNGHLLDNTNVKHISDIEVQVTLPVLDISKEPVDKYDGLMDVQFAGKKANQPLIDYNVKPIAVLNSDVNKGKAPLTVNFDASESNDPEKSKLTYTWDFGDGSDPKEGNAKETYVYQKAGDFKATVTCTDTDGAKGTANVDISVSSTKTGALGTWYTLGHDYTHSFRSPFVGPATNTLKWKYDANKSVHCSPVISPNGNIHFTTNSDKLFALDQDGNYLWSFGSNIWWVSITVGPDGTVYTGSNNGSRFYAVNADGTQKWEFPMSSWQSACPLLKPDGTITFGVEGDGNIYQLYNDGTQKWLKTYAGRTKSHMCTDDDGYIYFGGFYNGNDNSGILFCLNPDGTKRWEYETGGQIWNAPSILPNGNIVVGNRKGRVVVIDKWIGSKHWECNVSLPVSNIAVGVDGSIYFGCEDNKVYAYDATGVKKWEFITLGSVYGTPAIDAAGNLYVGSDDTYFYCISPEGKEIWKYKADYSIQNSAAITNDGSVVFGDMNGSKTDGSLYVIGPGCGQNGLEPPSSVKATDGNPGDRVIINWSAANNSPDGYYVYRSRKINGIWQYIGQTTTTTFEDLRAENDKLYEYRVQAYKASYNCSEYSESDQGFTKYLFPPDNFQASDGTLLNDIELTWEKPAKGTEPSGYKIYRSDDGGASYTIIATLGAVYKYTDLGLTKGIKYYYRIYSLEPLRESEEYAEDCGYIMQPQPPINFIASDGTDDTQVFIDLDPPTKGPAPDKYDIYVAPDNNGKPGTFTLLKAGVLEGEFPIATVPADGDTYWYYARSVKADYSDSEPCTPDSGWAKILSPPNTVRATDGLYPDKIVITWVAPTKGKKPDGYNIYRSTNATTGYNLIGSVGNVFEFEDKTCTPNTSYYYKVSSTKKDWQESGKSAEDVGYCGNWVKTLVTNIGGSYTSLTTLEDGSPCVAYYDSGNTNLMFARAKTDSPVSDSDWICMTVDNNTNNVGHYPSLLLTFGGTPLIAYQDNTTKNLLIAQTNQKFPSVTADWNIHIADDTNQVLSYVSAALNKSGKPAVVFYGGVGGSNDLFVSISKVVKPTAKADWNTYALVTDGDTGKYNSLALMSDGMLAVTYNKDNSVLSFTVATQEEPATAADWNTHNIFTSDMKWNKLVLLTDNTPAICGYDQTAQRMRLFTSSKISPRKTEDWSNVIYDDNINAGNYTSLNCLNSGVPYIFYTLAQNFDLRFAKALVSHPTSLSQFERGLIEDNLDSGVHISSTLLFCGMPAACYWNAGYNKLYFIRNTSLNENPKLFPPTSVDATDQAFKNKVQITWVVPQVGARPEQFQIHRSSTGEFGTYNLIGTTANFTNIYDDTTALSGTTYWYKVVSIRTNYPNSDYSEGNEGSVLVF